MIPDALPEVLVIGGGPAGSSAALLLARAGRRVTLVEREAGPHDKVCGEFISHEAAAYLTALGLDLRGLGAVAIRDVRLAGQGGVSHAALPFRALSLSRRRLDEALLGLAQAAGVTLARGRRVKALDCCGEAWRAALDGGETLEARAAFLATGKHDLKGRKRQAGLQNDLVAFKMHYRLTPAQAAGLAGAVELGLFPGGYAGLEPIEDGLANLCLLARQSALGDGPAWPAVLAALRSGCPLLDRRLEGAQPLWPKPLAIAAIPYGHVQQASAGVWRLGDQAAVIPSFAGDGVAIALHSAHAAAQAYLAGVGPDAFQARLARDLRLQVTGATLLSHGLVRPWAQGLIAAATRAQPWLLTATARRTRISGKVLNATCSTA